MAARNFLTCRHRFGIVEQNVDFDLLSPDKLMEKAVGRVITIVRTNPATGD